MIELDSVYNKENDFVLLNLENTLTNETASIMFKDKDKAHELAEDILEFSKISTIYGISVVFNLKDKKGIENFAYVRKMGVYQMREYFINMYMHKGTPGINIVGRPISKYMDPTSMYFDEKDVNECLDKYLRFAENLQRIGG